MADKCEIRRFIGLLCALLKDLTRMLVLRNGLAHLERRGNCRNGNGVFEVCIGSIIQIVFKYSVGKLREE